MCWDKAALLYLSDLALIYQSRLPNLVENRIHSTDLGTDTPSTWDQIKYLKSACSCYQLASMPCSNAHLALLHLSSSSLRVHPRQVLGEWPVSTWSSAGWIWSSKKTPRTHTKWNWWSYILQSWTEMLFSLDLELWKINRYSDTPMSKVSNPGST